MLVCNTGTAEQIFHSLDERGIPQSIVAKAVSAIMLIFACWLEVKPIEDFFVDLFHWANIGASPPSHTTGTIFCVAVFLT